MFIQTVAFSRHCSRWWCWISKMSSSLQEFRFIKIFFWAGFQIFLRMNNHCNLLTWVHPMAVIPPRMLAFSLREPSSYWIELVQTHSSLFEYEPGEPSSSINLNLVNLILFFNSPLSHYWSSREPSELFAYLLVDSDGRYERSWTRWPTNFNCRWYKIQFWIALPNTSTYFFIILLL